MRTGRFVGLAVTLALVSGSGVLRGGPEKEVKSDRVVGLIKELIKELGYDEFAKREAASKELVTLGPAALNALRKAATSSEDAEIRRRAGEIIQVIVQAQQQERIALLDKSLVDETEWLVAGFERGRLGAPHPVPWVFHRDGTVQAGDLWKGTWQADGQNAVLVISEFDECRVVFLSQRRFVAFKGDELYRQGSAP